MNIVNGILAFLLIPGHFFLVRQTILLLDETFEGQPTKLSEEADGLAFTALILSVTSILHGFSGYLLLEHGDKVTMNFVMVAGCIVSGILVTIGFIRGLSSSVWPVALTSTAVYVKAFELSSPGKQAVAYYINGALISLAAMALLAGIARRLRAHSKYALNIELKRYPSLRKDL